MFFMFLIFACVWIFLCFLDYMFRSCMFYPYIHAMGIAGITIMPFTINFYFTRFNRTFQKMSHYKPHLMRKWFSVGSVITCIVLVPSLALLVKTAVNIIFVKDAAQMDKQILQPVVPGINLPIGHLFYYFLALLFCSVVHELGHALAAAREGIQVQGCGVFILGIIPGAYVDLPGEQLLVLSRWQQMNIFCAGIWHNIVLVLTCVCLLSVNPLIFSPLFKLNSGITVVDISDKSGLGDSSGLSINNQIYDINDCSVKDVESWNTCITTFAGNPQPGYCASKTFIGTESSDAIWTDGCLNATEKLPFRYAFQDVKKHVCLPVRKLLSSTQLCNASSACSNPSDVCVTPLLPDIFRIFQIKRKNLSSVLYVGSHVELQYMTVTPWISKFELVPAWIVFTWETLLKYVASFSGALAILNVIPCPRLDGQWLCCILVEVLFSSFIREKSRRKFIAQGLMTCGCFLITITVIASVYQLLQN